MMNIFTKFVTLACVVTHISSQGMAHNAILRGSALVKVVGDEENVFASSQDIIRVDNVPLAHMLEQTGVTVADEVITEYRDFKLGKLPLRYFIYNIVDKTMMIAIEKRGELEKTYDDFVADLPESEPRYGVFDLHYVTDDGRSTSSYVFFAWIPDTAKVRDRMVYRTSLETLKWGMNFRGTCIIASEYAELDLETSVLPQVKKFGGVVESQLSNIVVSK